MTQQKRSLPLFPLTTVGSWPRPPELLRALGQMQRGKLPVESFNRLADEAVLDVLRIQEEAGIDLVTDGEQRRDNFYSFVATKLDGVRLMSLSEMLDIVEDKAGFEQILQALDVPAYSMKNPTCIGKIHQRESLALDEYRFLAQHTTRSIKVTLPGPYLLTRSMWVKEVTQAVYTSKEELAEDVVSILQGEALALREAGADFIQFDEPVLTELVFTQGRTRTFMCAALAATQDPTEELNFAVSLINRVVANLEGIRTGMHICRGNWSQKESILLNGSYSPLLPFLEQMHVQQLILEYATPRAGELASLLSSAQICQQKELGLGVVNPRTAEIESANAIVTRVKEALAYLPPERIFLNPDCGFGTFASRPMNTWEIAKQKLIAMAEAATCLRREYMSNTATSKQKA
jgi:5-methyltetrahydropteroyltriglutamate--homocysteine methyltransferase